MGGEAGLVKEQSRERKGGSLLKNWGDEERGQMSRPGSCGHFSYAYEAKPGVICEPPGYPPRTKWGFLAN